MDQQLQLSKQLVIGEMLARWARKTPNNEAFVCEDKRYTYGEFNERVNRLAHGLKNMGVQKGDKVAVLFMNCLEIIESYFAILKLGAVVVPLNFRLVGRELIYQINHSDSKLVIYDDRFQQTIQSIQDQLPAATGYTKVGGKAISEIADYEQMISESESHEPLILIDDDDDAFIMYTSGTTGRPKGVVLTHKNLMMSAINTLIESFFSGEERWLCIPPLFHGASTASMLRLVFVGGVSVIMEQFVPEAIPPVIEKERISYLFLVPAMWIFLMETPDLNKYDLSSLKKAVTGAAVMPTEVKKRLMETFPGIMISDTFGQTEMSPSTTTLKSEDSLRKPGSVGKPIINVEVRVVDHQDQDVPVGQVGEIVYRGPTVMKEYYKNPEATAEAKKNGWFHSGDLVRQDEEGYFYVVDRSKDMIISGGENIYAAEVEEALYNYPDILEAAVIGIPDIKWGESVKAVVVVREGSKATEQKIIEHCRTQVASYKKPKSVNFVKELPKNATGKILKFKLRENYLAN